MYQSGSIIYIDFDPTKGHEQAGRRPAVIVSNNDFGKYVGLAVVCPITNRIRNYPTHVKLDSRTKTTGEILCDQVRTMDLEARNADFVEKLPNDLFFEVKDIVRSIFD